MRKGGPRYLALLAAFPALNSGLARAVKMDDQSVWEVVHAGQSGLFHYAMLVQLALYRDVCEGRIYCKLVQCAPSKLNLAFATFRSFVCAPFNKPIFCTHSSRAYRSCQEHQVQLILERSNAHSLLHCERCVHPLQMSAISKNYSPTTTACCTNSTATCCLLAHLLAAQLWLGKTTYLWVSMSIPNVQL